MKFLFRVLLISFLTGIKTASAQWNELGGPNSLMANSYIKTLFADSSGNIYAAGNFTNNFGKRYVAKWDGTSWTELGGLNTLSANSFINSICSDPAGNIYAAGDFTSLAGTRYVAKWDGTSWTELGGSNSLAANQVINSICSDPAGNIYATGFFGNSTFRKYVAKWDGVSWTELGGVNSMNVNANGPVYTVRSDASGNIYAAGTFQNSYPRTYVAKFDGSNWSELGGFNGLAGNDFIRSICFDPTGNVYAAGDFNNSAGKKYVARYDGNTWTETGGLNALAANYWIWSVCSDLLGNIYAGGRFTSANPYPNGDNNVMYWDGTSWTALGGINPLAADSTIYAVCSDAAGNIYAAGEFKNGQTKCYVAKYSFSTGMPQLNAVGGLKIFPNPSGNLVQVQSENSIINEIKIIDLSGKAVSAIDDLNAEKTTVDVSEFPSGIYFIEILTEKGKVQRKFLKQ